jgi:hypothetical protein
MPAISIIYLVRALTVIQADTSSHSVTGLGVLLEYSGLISAVVALIGLSSLVLAWRQLSDARKWNKRNAAYTYFPSAQELQAIESELEALCAFWTRPETEPYVR